MRGKKISKIHFECHWNNRDKIADLKKSYAKLGITAKVKCVAETFDLTVRENVMNKGIGMETGAKELSQFF